MALNLDVRSAVSSSSPGRVVATSHPEQLVVAEMVGDYINDRIVHLPQRKPIGGIRFDAFDFPPSTWPPACGGFRSGSVYVRAGMLENAVVCPECEAAGETVEDIFVCQIDESAGLREDTA